MGLLFVPGGIISSWGFGGEGCVGTVIVLGRGCEIANALCRVRFSSSPTTSFVDFVATGESGATYCAGGSRGGGRGGGVRGDDDDGGGCAGTDMVFEGVEVRLREDGGRDSDIATTLSVMDCCCPKCSVSRVRTTIPELEEDGECDDSLVVVLRCGDIRSSPPSDADSNGDGSGLECSELETEARPDPRCIMFVALAEC